MQTTARKAVFGFLCVSIAIVVCGGRVPFISRPAASARPSSKSVPAASPMTTAEAVRALIEAWRDDKPVVLWDALPPGYQRDLAECAHRVAARVPTDVCDQLADLCAAYGDYQKEVRTRFESMSGAANEEPKGNPLRSHLLARLDTSIALIDAIRRSGVSDLASASRAGSADVSRFLRGSGRDILQNYARILTSYAAGGDASRLTDWFAGVRVSQTALADGRATVRIEGPDVEVEEVEFELVEEKWIPSEMARIWKTVMQELGQQIDAVQWSDEEVRKFAEAVGEISRILHTLLMQFHENPDEALKFAVVGDYSLMLLLNVVPAGSDPGGVKAP